MHTAYTKPILKAVSVRYDNAARVAVVRLENGLEVVLSDDSPLLNGATPDDIDGAEISPSGHGFSIPRVDADICVLGLVRDGGLVVDTETAYRGCMALIERLLAVVGDDEAHELAPLLDAVADKALVYENEHFLPLGPSTIAAINEARAGNLPAFKSVEELLKDLNS